MNASCPTCTNAYSGVQKSWIPKGKPPRGDTTTTVISDTGTLELDVMGMEHSLETVNLGGEADPSHEALE